MKRKTVVRLASPLLIAALVFFSAALPFAKVAQAAALSTLSDTMTNLNTSGTTSNDILFTIPATTGGGFPVGGTISLTFASSTGTAPALAASLPSANITIKYGPSSPSNTGTITTCTVTCTSVANSASAWGYARTSATVLTLTAPSGSVTGIPVSAGTAVFFEIILGTPGTSSTYLLTHGNTGNTETLAIATSPGDSGTIAMPIVANDQVTVTATVSPTISFALSTNAVNFGTLTSGAARYATTGSGGTGSTTDVSATTLTVNTNATAGYNVTYNAPSSLTDGSHPLTVITPGTAGSAVDPGGIGSSQFGISVASLGGSPTIVGNYSNATPKWGFATSTTTQIFSNAGTTSGSGDLAGIHYVANIPGSQPAGIYSVTITFIATGNF